MTTQSRRSAPLAGPYDLAIVGGGINGAGIARDAAMRGKSVLLLEKGDFGGGTSSRTSRMVHGGIRYLESFRFGLVFEALRERYTLLNLAPHLIRRQSFVIPAYEGDPRGPRKIGLGLFLYNFLCVGRNIGKAHRSTREEVTARVPDLLRDGLMGGGVYYDGVMDDARLCLVNVIAAVESNKQGTVVARNYTEVTDTRAGSPTQLRAHDQLTGETFTVYAHQVVRALGPWTEIERLAPSKGVHIVLPPFPTKDGLLMSHAKDGRPFFLIPWRGLTVVGTTETPFSGKPESLRVEPDEARYLLSEIRRLFPKITIAAGDILGTFSGVRPLARSRGWLPGRGNLGRVSRTHRIFRDGPVTTVVGGKYTTYRAVAAEVVTKLFPGSECRTHREPLPGGEQGNWDEYATNHPPPPDFSTEDIERLFYLYGSRLHDVLRLIEEDPALGERLAPEVDVLRAEVVYGVRNEFVCVPEDFLVRRTQLRYSEDNGRSAYAAVEELIRQELPIDDDVLAAARGRYFAELEWEDELRRELG